ncbi:MAG: cold shock domain-containing protein [Planctomycetes bacterium]|nr:cold shock domain-containing protein [Planctomycetota bacterium]
MPITKVKTRGTVIWYDARKGYGYASRKGAPEVFLHYGAIRGDGVIELKPGQEIEFVLEQTDRGAVAHEINLVK